MPKNLCPEAIPIREGAYVTLPSEAWKQMCDVVNHVRALAHSNAEMLSKLSTELDVCKSNVSKIATITEEMYENLE